MFCVCEDVSGDEIVRGFVFPAQLMGMARVVRNEALRPLVLASVAFP